ISMTSPRRAFAGTLMRAAAAKLDLLHACGKRDDDVHPRRPERAVAQLGDRLHGLRIGKAYPGRYLGPPGARTQPERRNLGQWVLLVEDMDRPDMVGAGHGTVDTHGERHAVPVLDQRRQLELHLPRVDP